MARNFLAFPFAPYNGSYSSKSFNSDGGLKGIMLPIDLLWPSFQFNGQPLGNAIPNFAVSVNLNTAGPNSVSGQFYIQSVYIDNEAVDFPVYVYFLDTQFTISCPANAAGWYQVFTNARQCLVAAVGITNKAIAANQRTKLFFTDVAMVPSLDEETQSAVDLRVASPTISLSGGGIISSAQITAQGSSYSSGALTVSGGGGQNGAAHGVLYNFGRFTQIVIDNPGTGYVGAPLITPNGPQVGQPPAWITAHSYNQGETVSFNGFSWQASQANNSVQPGTTNQFGQLCWNQICQNNLGATFSCTVTGISGSSIQSTNYGPAALGDQALSFVDTLSTSNPDIFRANLFGTPFGSGLIRLTSVWAASLNAAGGTWVLENSAGATLFQYSIGTAPCPVLDLSNCNIDLDATLEWHLRRTGGTGGLIVNAFTWTQNANI